MKNTLRSALIAGAAALGVIGGMAPMAQAADGVIVSRERGHVLDCRGKLGELTVAVSLYDNSEHGSFAAVVVDGEEGPVYGGSSEPSSLFRGNTVATGIPLERTADQRAMGKAVVVGAFLPKGKPVPVHEVVDDAGYIIESTGTHRRLATKVGVSLLGKYTALTCQDAFRYDLKVTKTPA